MAQAVVPVITKIVKHECEDPHAPVAGRQTNGRPMLKDPLVKEDSKKPEEYAHAGADDAAAQAIDGIGQMVAAASARPVDDNFQDNQKQKYRNCQRHGLSVKIVHTGITVSERL